MNDSDISRAVNRIISMMRRRDCAEPGDEAELREFARKWLTEHPEASYMRLYGAVIGYVKDNMYSGPLTDYWAEIRPRSLKASREGYGGHA